MLALAQTESARRKDKEAGTAATALDFVSMNYVSMECKRQISEMLAGSTPCERHNIFSKW